MIEFQTASEGINECAIGYCKGNLTINSITYYYCQSFSLNSTLKAYGKFISNHRCVSTLNNNEYATNIKNDTNKTLTLLNYKADDCHELLCKNLNYYNIT